RGDGELGVPHPEVGLERKVHAGDGELQRSAGPGRDEVRGDEARGAVPPAPPPRGAATRPAPTSPRVRANSPRTGSRAATAQRTPILGPTSSAVPPDVRPPAPKRRPQARASILLRTTP